MALLKVDELTVRFGGTPVLDAVSFEIGKGQGPHWLKTLGRMTIYNTVETAADADGDVRAVAARVD